MRFRASVLLSCAFVLLPGSVGHTAEPEATAPIDLGSRRELFLDDHLIDRMAGTSLRMHSPALATGPGWAQEHYSTVLKEPTRFLMYTRRYRDSKVDWNTHGWDTARRNELTTLLTSSDGIRWEEPNFGLHDAREFPAGNVIIANEPLAVHNFTPFIDARPGCDAESRFKAIGGMHYQPQFKKFSSEFGPGGLYAFGSPDGIRWSRLQQEAVIPEEWGTFDSQNVAFWSTTEKRYVCYFRTFVKGFRSISSTTSEDFLHWTAPEPVTANLPHEHLYTSGAAPYFRAPHMTIALPTRFQSNRASTTDIMLMSSRTRNRFDRTFKEAFIRPGLGGSGWGNRSNYAALNIVPTSDSEISIYLAGNRRFTLRYDGFASLHAGYDEGQMVTKPLIFDGRGLDLNYSTSAAGRIRIELQDSAGVPIPGFELARSKTLIGDKIAGTAAWENKSADDLKLLAGKPIRMRFVMDDSDVFSFRFF